MSFSYISMIKLLPTTSEQTISFIPRDYTVDNEVTSLLSILKARSSNFENETGSTTILQAISGSAISMVIVEDGTRNTQTISNVPLALSGNFINATVSITILTAENTYSFEIKNDEVLLYRDKIYCTSQTSTTVSHTLNTDKYTEVVGNDSTVPKYIVV